jgi:ADP-heptose:LPS heptosyltransferase
VDVLASPANAGVLEAHPNVHRVFVRTGWRDWLLLFPRLRRQGYDVVFSFIYGKGLREGLIASAIGRRQARKISVMRPTRYHGLFTNVIRVPRTARHMAEQLSYVVRHSFASVDERPSTSYPMHLATDAKAEERASAFLTEHQASDVVVVNIAAAEPWREWPWSNCVDVLRELLPRWLDVTFVLVTPPEKLSRAESVVDACASDRVILFPPSRRFLDVVALFGRARLVLTTDTASVHIASASGRPVVALYSGIRTTTGLWSPVGVPARSLRAEAGRPVSTIAAEQIVHSCEELYAETALLRA